MSRDLGKSPDASVPPAARRAARPGWRDPRWWIGVLLVTGSVVAGARLLSAADDTVRVWALTQERGPGSPVAAEDLVVERVRFADGAAHERYFSADAAVPDDLVLVRAVGEGELLARSAVAAADAEPVLRVPLEVDPNRVPPDVVTGSVVDVWVADDAAPATPGGTGPADGGGGTEGAPGADRSTGPALSEVTVVAAPSYDDSFAVTGARQLVVAVDDERAVAFERLLAGMEDPVIRILQRS